MCEHCLIGSGHVTRSIRWHSFSCLTPFLGLRWHQFHHSPTDIMQSKGEIVQSGLPLGKRLCQCISENKLAKPNCFFHRMHCSYILSLCCGQCDKLLLSGAPGDHSSIDKEHVARNCVTMFLVCAVCICVSYEIITFSSISQLVSLCSREIVKGLLHCFLVNDSGIFEELQKC